MQQINFATVENIINSLNKDQNSDVKFKIDRQQYILDKDDTDNTHVTTASTNSSAHACSLDLQKPKQVQHQDEYITKLIAKCKYSKNNKTPVIWMSMELNTERSEMNLISFMLFWLQIPCNPIFYMSAIMHWDTMVPPDCTISLEEIIIGKSYVNAYIPAQNVNR